MDVERQKITADYATYNGDCIKVMPKLKKESVHLSIYSPPFAEMYNYSSSNNDLSNCNNYKEFLIHYEFVIKEISRLTIPGRATVVHCMDLKRKGFLIDFPGDIIRLHEKHNFRFHSRIAVWKEPLRVALRTRSLHLAHRQIVKDSIKCGVAGADYILTFCKVGNNSMPVTHPDGLSNYVGDRAIPSDLVKKYNGWKNPRTNKLSHWIWQQYASSFWDDIRAGNVLPYRLSRESEEEKHVCPLQLDVIERCIILWSNKGENVLTPFMGVGSEVYGALLHRRKGIGIELKLSYFKQALRNLEKVKIDMSKRKSGFFRNVN